MINLAIRARSLARRFGLNSALAPFVERWESSRLAELGSYHTRRIDDRTLEIRNAEHRLLLSNLPAVQCELGMSDHERPTMLTVLKLVSRGSVAWDIGANVGFYSQVMAALVGDGGRVVSFEPSPNTFAELGSHVAKWPQVTPMGVALSDRDGKARFALMESHTSVGRIVSDSMSGESGFATVATARGDTLVAEQALTQPAFLKIDVEGHELSVLSGLQKTLSDTRCKAVLIEVHFAMLEGNGLRDAPRKIIDLLRQCGLRRQRWIARSHLLAQRD